METSPINYQEVLQQTWANGLNGAYAHLAPNKILDGVTLQSASAQVPNAPYTIWQLLGHLNFWQVELLAIVAREKRPKVETAAAGWPTETAPPNEAAWNAEVKRLLNSIEEMNKALATPSDGKEPLHKWYPTVYDVAQCMASHLSYHLGEIMLLRRILGNYPPPGGGATW